MLVSILREGISMKTKIGIVRLFGLMLCPLLFGCVTIVEGEKFSYREWNTETTITKFNDRFRDKTLPLDDHSLLYIDMIKFGTKSSYADMIQRVSNFGGKFGGMTSITSLESGVVGLIPSGTHELKTMVKDPNTIGGYVTLEHTFEPGKIYVLLGDREWKSTGFIGAMYGVSSFVYTPIIVALEELIKDADDRGTILLNARFENINTAFADYRKKQKE
jgi:hypothetical protein